MPLQALELSFGQTFSAPGTFQYPSNYGADLGINNGIMAGDDADEATWITFRVAGHRGGAHDVFLRYAAQSPRPMRLRVNGRLVGQVAAGSTGGWGSDNAQWSRAAECRVDLGAEGEEAVVQLKAFTTRRCPAAIPTAAALAVCCPPL